MDFVIFSYNYLPQNDAEAFCTARFANALAEEGHNVHVVTVEHTQKIPKDLELELAPAIKKITKVPIKPIEKSFVPRIKYQTAEWDARDYGECIKTLKNVLSQYERPILISRMCPAASGIIAWHCRKQAALWVNHFSDPFPNYLKGGVFGKIVNQFTFRWARRFLTDSDFCTITCTDVIRFFRERVIPVSDDKFTLVPHIGEPLISADDKWRSPCPAKPYIAHAGNCYDGRYAKELVRELLLSRNAGCDIAFVQAGDILEKDIKVLEEGNIDFRRIRLNSPREASSIFKDAAINLVIDLKIDYGGYTPFIPSKFVYLLYTDKPIVVFARTDSWMYRLVKEYPESGIWFADVKQEGALAKVCHNILQHDISEYHGRIALRELFSKHQAVQAFLKRCESLMK